MSGEAVGYMILLGLDGVHRAMELRRLVVTAKGCGYGRAAVRMIKTFAFEGLAAHRLWHDVKEFNHRARRLYASEGFTVEGMLRECYLGENGFESVYVMSMLVDGLKRIRECSFGSIEPRIQKCSAHSCGRRAPPVVQITPDIAPAVTNLPRNRKPTT